MIKKINFSLFSVAMDKLFSHEEEKASFQIPTVLKNTK